MHEMSLLTNGPISDIYLDSAVLLSAKKFGPATNFLLKSKPFSRTFFVKNGITAFANYDSQYTLHSFVLKKSRCRL